MMYQILLVIYLLVSLALIVFVLLQQGKGANAGASFGGGVSGTVFGSAGSGNFLSRTTAVLAVVFFAISLTIGNINAHRDNLKSGTFDDLSQIAEKVQQEDATKAAQEKAAEEKSQHSDIPQ